MPDTAEDFLAKWGKKPAAAAPTTAEEFLAKHAKSSPTAQLSALREPDLSAIQNFDVGPNDTPARDPNEYRREREADVARGVAARERIDSMPITSPENSWNREQHGWAANAIVGAGDTLTQSGKRLYHGVVDPIAARRAEQEATLSDRVRAKVVRDRAAANPSTGSAMLPPDPESGDAWKDVKAVGHSALGAGMAIFAPWMAPASIADEESGANVLPAWSKASAAAADKLVPRSMPGSYADRMIPESVRQGAVDVTAFGIENAPFAALPGARELARDVVDRIRPLPSPPLPEIPTGRGPVEMPIKRPALSGQPERIPLPGETLSPAELAALGDEAWQGVEPAPAPAKPAEAPPRSSAFERRMQRGPQPRSSLDEANPTGDLAADIPAMRASKLWDDPNYAPYGRDPKTGKRLTSDPHALDEAAWRAANEPEFAEPRFGERDPYPEATKKLVIKEAEEAAAPPSPPEPIRAQPEPAAPSAPDVPAAPPREGPTLGAGLGALGKDALKAPERVYDMADAALGRVSKPIAKGINALGEKTGKLGDTVAEQVVWQPRRISEAYATLVRQMGGEKVAGSMDAVTAVAPLKEALKNVGTRWHEDVTHVLQGYEPTTKIPPQVSRQVVENLKSELIRVGDEMEARGLVSPEARSQFIDKTYMQRQYRQAPEMGGAELGTRPRTEFNFVREDRPGVYLKGVTKSEVVKLANDHGGIAPTVKGTNGAIKFETPEARQAFVDAMHGTGKIASTFDEIPRWQRESMGEVLDPAVLATSTLRSMKSRLAIDRFFEKLSLPGAGDAKGTWTVRIGPKGVPENYTAFEHEWGGKWLKGRAVRNDVYNDIVGTWGREPQQAMDSFGKGFADGYISAFKAAKTIAVPAAHGRQFLALPQFSIQAGISLLNPANWKTWRQGLRMFNENHPLFREAVEQGVMENRFYEAELRDTMNRLNASADPMQEMYTMLGEDAGRAPTTKANRIGRQIGANLALPGSTTKIGQAIVGKIGRAYGFWDQWLKNSVYVDRRASGMSPAEAAREVSNYTPTFSEVGPGVKAYRSKWWGAPFAGFAVESKRVFKNAAVNHPARAATSFLFQNGVNAAVALALGSAMSDKDRERIAKARGSMEIPLGKNASYNAEYVDPNGDIKSLLGMGHPGPIGESNVFRQFMDITKLGGNPIYNTITSLGRGTDQWGNEVYGKDRSFTGKLASGTGFALSQGLPPWVPGGVHWNRMKRSIKGDYNPRYPNQPPLLTLLALLTSLDARPFSRTSEILRLEKQADRAASREPSEAGKVWREFSERIK